MKNLIKLTMIMCVTATSLFMTSCTEKENDPNAITETNLVGEWGFTDNSQNPDISINADHTCKIGNQPYDWTLDGSTFKATQDGTSNTCEFDITELNGHVMKIVGSRVYFGTTSDYSGSLLRTHTETPTKLNENDMLGSWKHYDPNDNAWEDFSFTINDNHTGKFNSNEATWSISGTTLTMDYSNGNGYMHATIKTITTSAKKVMMEVEGSRGWHQSWGDDDYPFTGTFVKDL